MTTVLVTDYPAGADEYGAEEGRYGHGDSRLRPDDELLAGLIRGTTDAQLGDPTPCPDYTVADLVDHIGGLALAFTLSARKEEIPGGGNPSADGSRLEDGWRDRIAAQLASSATRGPTRRRTRA